MRPLQKQSSKARRLGFWAGLFSGLDSGKMTPTKQEIERLDFATSTQKMGLSFTEKLREIFRFHWLRKR